MDSNLYQIIILPEAEEDIENILRYIAVELKNSTTARNLWLDIQDAIKRVKLYPFAMPKVKNELISQTVEYRRVDVHNYVIVYKVEESIKEIKIFAVLYSRSNFEKHILSKYI